MSYVVVKNTESYLIIMKSIGFKSELNIIEYIQSRFGFSPRFIEEITSHGETFFKVYFRQTPKPKTYKQIRRRKYY